MTTTNPPAAQASSYRVGDLDLNRIGYGAMQLAGPGVFGPPRDRAAAIEVLRTAVELGVNHIDTADAYGPYITNEIIREAALPVRRPCAHRDQGRVGPRRAGWLAARQLTSVAARAGARQPPPAGLDVVIAKRADAAVLAATAGQHIAYVPYFPLGGFSPLQSDVLESVAKRLGATPTAVAQSWLLQHSPNIMLIPGTSSVAHLRENIAGGALTLPA